MNKANVVYRQIAEEILQNRRAKLVERKIAKNLGISPDTVNNAIAPLKRIGAVTVQRRHFEVIDFKKLLLYWAVNRKFDKDIIYETYVPVKSPEEIENYLPEGIAFTNFSGYKKIFNESPADYGEVYVYAERKIVTEIKIRFSESNMSPKRGKYNNLIVLRPDSLLENSIESHIISHSSVSLPQLYVDLWNNGSWMAYEFIKSLEKRIDEIYEKAILE